MIKMKMNRGFTLIELLVVIAIIGILSSVVLVSLNTARNKGKDARVISDVQQLRIAIESNYDGSQYTALTGTASQANVAGTISATVPYSQLTADAISQGGLLGVRVATNAAGNATAYAIYGSLSSGWANSFCIDSTGKTSPTATASSTVICP